MKVKSLSTLKFLIVFVLAFLSNSNNYAQLEKVDIKYDRLSDKVLVLWGGEVYRDQVIAVATEKGIVMIDAGKSPTLTAEYRKIIEREFRRNDFAYVIDTHYHYDHTSGNQVFDDATIIANQKTPALMKNWADNRQAFVDARRANQLPRWINQRDAAEPGSEEWKRFNDFVTTQVVMLDDYENDYIMTLPDITFNDKMTLDMGDATFYLYYFGEGMHTGDDILIHYPEEKILFSGDLFYGKWFCFAFVPHFDGERWIKVLDEIFDNNEIKWVYDNHNGRMSGEFITLFKNYMKDVWESLVQAKESGMSFEKVKDVYSFDNKFTYIEKSGLDENTLRANHESNIMFTWYCINNTKSASDVLAEVINSEGIKAAVSKYAEIKEAPPEKYFFDERELNNLGYQLMGRGKITEAIEIFKIMVEKYPNSANAYDSLGEAYLNNGQRDLALRNYEKSLQLNPSNTNAANILKQLK